jgi:hypothetical protein
MFPCTGCGLCCKNISTIEQLKDYDLGNGVCKFLKDNQCSIYYTRPDICQIDKMFDIKYLKYFSREEFYEKNASICNSMQELLGLDNSYRVKL